MYIYIDESGSFAPPQKYSTSVVGALVIPEARSEQLLFRFNHRVRRTLPTNDRGEVKGAKLDEVSVIRVAELLYDHEAVFVPVVVDRKFFGASDIASHRDEQASRIENPKTPSHPEMVSYWRGVAAKIRALSDPLYVQLVCQVELISRVLRTAPSYFASRRPSELAQFKWVLDSKSDHSAPGENPMEHLWRTLVSPFMQASFLQEPLYVAEGLDFSHMSRSFTKGELPAYLRPFTIPAGPGTTAFSVSDMLGRDVVFSAGCLPGLELVDVLVNAVGRALKGNLQRHALSSLAKLMVHRPEGYLRMLTLGRTPSPDELEYIDAWRCFTNGGRNLLTTPLMKRLGVKRT